MVGHQDRFRAGAVAFSIALAAQANAADVAPLPPTSNSVFTGAAWLRASGLEGSTGVLGYPPTDIDLSFADVLENLDGALMGAAKLRNGRFSVGADLTYSDSRQTSTRRLASWRTMWA